MLKRFLLPGAAIALALLTMFAPWQAGSSSAQMDGMDHGGQMGQADPMMSQLDQLSGDEFDRAFLVQMSMHHAMAISMARPALANAPHQEVKDLARGIIESQAQEIGEQAAWLKAWYSMDMPPMVGMMEASNTMPMPMDGHHPMGDMMSMGMAMLWELPGPRLEAAFLSQMIPHHQGAVKMARLAAERAGHQEIKDLARSIEQSQSDEIQQMIAWLAVWYGL